MSERQYYKPNGNPCTLHWLVRHEQAWAANQIRHRDRLEAENAALRSQVEPKLLSEQALDLCHAIERGVACEQLTKCSVLAAELRKEIEVYEDTRPLTDEERNRIAIGWNTYRAAIDAAREGTK